VEGTAPGLGEDTAEVLRDWLGVTATGLQRLRGEKAL